MHTRSEKILSFLLSWSPGAPLATLCWAVACSAFEGIRVISATPLLIAVIGVWVAAGYLQPAPPRKQSEGNRNQRNVLSHLQHITLLGCLVWLCGWRANQLILEFFSFPATLFFISRFFRGRILRVPGIIMQSMALGMTCAAPALYFSFLKLPFQLVFCVPVCYLGVLFCIAAWERTEIRQGKNSHLCPAICAGMLLAASLHHSKTAAPFEQAFFTTIAIGGACLMVAPLLYRRLSIPAAILLNWLAVILPAVAGILLYAPACR